MNHLRRTAALLGASGLASASLLHGYWLAGGHRGISRVIPTTDGHPTFRPGPLATAGVATALAAAAALYAGAGLGGEPRWMYRAGTLGAATILAARAIGDRDRLGFFKTERSTHFARLDTAVLSPLCAALSCAGLIAAT
jgi:Protein of unknown function (DUF3995)